RLFVPALPDISRQDNAERATAAYHLAQVWRTLILDTAPQSRRLAETLLAQIFRFMGEPQDAAAIHAMTADIFENLDHADPERRRPAGPTPSNGATAPNRSSPQEEEANS